MLPEINKSITTDKNIRAGSITRIIADSVADGFF